MWIYELQIQKKPIKNAWGFSGMKQGFLCNLYMEPWYVSINLSEIADKTEGQNRFGGSFE